MVYAYVCWKYIGVVALARMAFVWLLLHYNSKDFDVRVEDTDLCHLMGLYEDIMEESAKQNVYLPKAFRLLVHNPWSNRKMEIESDMDLERVWSFGRGTDTIEMWVEETNNPRIVFRAYVQLREQAEKEKLENIRRVQEILRNEQEEEERRQICEYMRVFETEGADECCPGPSQPTASPSKQPTSPPTPTKQPTPQTPSPSKQYTPPHSPLRAHTPPPPQSPLTQQTPPPSPPRDPTLPPSPPRDPTPPPSPPRDPTLPPSPPRDPTPPPSPPRDQTPPSSPPRDPTPPLSPPTEQTLPP
ncbi:uncharacterized protein LOC109135636 [Beta vulgaris subsp. vulgaris]|uniref:uncharacterized protein LOC109135636 n=1 Tax=Beta vulgaris subsp. vulgaris TaxID=3555 RepID=UPI0020373064|nr:uncharacterized protein LOC109135636 [Beta vulgaris subsp. vulgaris]